MFSLIAMAIELEAMGRVLQHIEAHQSATGVCPDNYSAIGRAVSLSHTHVRRLLSQAIEKGSIERVAGGHIYSRISWVSEKSGGIRVPRTTVHWDSPLSWKEEGVAWLDPQLFELNPRFQHWLVQFKRPEPDVHPSTMNLGPHVMAIVRLKLDLSRLSHDPHQWWLVEGRDGHVTSMQLATKTEFYVEDPAFGRRGFTIKVGEEVQAVLIVKLFECRSP